MRLITSISEMKGASRGLRATRRRLALVPTMGALHEGHLSLVRRAKSECDAVVVSIFINPTQFGPSEDFAGYPRSLERDLDLLAPLQVDAAFTPGAADMYPARFDTYVEPGALALTLEGAARPGHFRGVMTAVLKLFNIVQPQVACFGQKDFQQAVIIRRLIRDLDLDVRMVVCPTVRETDGLAMSSRNAYLSGEDRPAALALYGSLERVEELARAGETRTEVVLEEMKRVVVREPRAKLDYAVIVDPERLEPIERVEPGSVALVAAQVGRARLIDNLILGPAGASDEERLRLAFERGAGSTV